MHSLFESLIDHLGPGRLERLSLRIGASPRATRAALPAALATLVSALSRNAGAAHGARALHAALHRDHDGSVLDARASFPATAAADPGQAILRHVLGERQSTVERGLSGATGLDPSAGGRLLATLAPLVMGVLGRQQRRDGLDATDLARLLQFETLAMRAHAPAGVDAVLGLLDTDRDDSVFDDPARVGAACSAGCSTFDPQPARPERARESVSAFAPRRPRALGLIDFVKAVGRTIGLLEGNNPRAQQRVAHSPGEDRALHEQRLAGTSSERSRSSVSRSTT